MDNSASMNEVIYHETYRPLTTYTGDYTSGRIYYFKDTDYKTMDFTVATNGKTAKLYWGPGDENSGVRYNGNYLNWIYWHATDEERNNLPQKRRIQVAREVLVDVLNNTTGVRFGLMTLNSENGGTVIADCGTSKETLINAINGILATTWTPMSETMVEAWLYFTGDKKSYYNNAKYTTPIQYYCQKNFIVSITDGEPTRDWTFPDWVLTAIAGKYDTTPQSGNSGYPYYFDGVAWYLNNNDAHSKLDGRQNVSTNTIGFNIDHPLLQRTAANGGGIYLTASNRDQLGQALEEVLKDIDDRSFSFTAPTVPAVRTNDLTDNVVYITTFEPSEKPFWKGNVLAYRLEGDGTLKVDAGGNPASTSLIWDAHGILKTISSDSRKIYTYLGGIDKDEFKVANSSLTKEVLDVAAGDRDKLIKHIRGIDAYDINNNGKWDEKRLLTENIWILGDIFHSNPVIVGEPSRFFEDTGFNGPGGFYEEYKNRIKVILVGANDGMLHAFNATSGVEEWAFIPNSLLKNLKSMVSAHTYYVDSSVKVADVWFGDVIANGKKDRDEWKTVLVSGLRKGGKHYFALDITDTSNPKYLWEFPKTQGVLDRIGQSWSEPAIGRVKIDGIERWVIFIGGGFDDTNVRGKAIFVIDIKTGDIIREFSSNLGTAGMDYSFAAPPTAVDLNFDGYIDKVYIGDLAGQMWVFDVSSNNITEWRGQILFEKPGTPAEKNPIYYQPAVAFDKSRIPWVYFGTGDRENPTDQNSKEGFYAVKDDGKPPYPRNKKAHLKNRTDYPEDIPFSPPEDPLKGWYIDLAMSEKVLAKPTVFNKILYFTTYTYTSTDVCKATGDGALYVVEYLSGGGALALDAYLQGKSSGRRESIGEGIPSAPVISADLHGQATVTIGTTSGKILSRGVPSPSTSKEILYWREVIP